MVIDDETPLNYMSVSRERFQGKVDTQGFQAILANRKAKVMHGAEYIAMHVVTSMRKFKNHPVKES